MGEVKTPPFFNMLEVIKNLKVRRDNLYVPITSYRIQTMLVDLRKSDITINVDFYRNDILLFSRGYLFNEKGNVDVDILIEKTHRIIDGNN